MAINAALARIWRRFTAALFTLCRLNRRRVRLWNLRQQIQQLIGHELQYPLFRHCMAAELRGGQGGWVPPQALKRSMNGYFVHTNTPLFNTPKGSTPALVVLDDDGVFHLFRFGWHSDEPVIRHVYGIADLPLTDHGCIGPARFDFG